MVNKHIDQGGLGIPSVDKVNKAILGKWLWRVGELGQVLWRRILIPKYKLGNDGWCVPSQLFKTSGFWKSILSVKDDFVLWIRFRVHMAVRFAFVMTSGVGSLCFLIFLLIFIC